MLSKLYKSDESTHDYTHSSTCELSKAKSAHKIYITHIFKVISHSSGYKIVQLVR